MTPAEKLRAGQATIGAWLQTPSPSSAEILARCGYDWVAVDMEHGHISAERLPDLFRAIELGGAVPFVRVAYNLDFLIKQALDAGAKGLIVPMVESGEALRRAIQTALYPPDGERGVGFCRANLFGKEFQNYAQSINHDLVIVAQIEHVRAIEQIEDILQVPGLSR